MAWLAMSRSASLGPHAPCGGQRRRLRPRQEHLPRGVERADRVPAKGIAVEPRPVHVLGGDALRIAVLLVAPVGLLDKFLIHGMQCAAS